MVLAGPPLRNNVCGAGTLIYSQKNQTPPPPKKKKKTNQTATTPPPPIIAVPAIVSLTVNCTNVCFNVSQLFSLLLSTCFSCSLCCSQRVSSVLIVALNVFQLFSFFVSRLRPFSFVRIQTRLFLALSLDQHNCVFEAIFQNYIRGGRSGFWKEGEGGGDLHLVLCLEAVFFFLPFFLFLPVRLVA